jgi:predicted RNase H-like nuclease
MRNLRQFVDVFDCGVCPDFLQTAKEVGSLGKSLKKSLGKTLEPEINAHTSGDRRIERFKRLLQSVG